MNTDPSSVPIITLAGVSSLTNLLSDLPFPVPLPQTKQCSLLYNNWLKAESQKSLSCPNSNPCIQELLQVLRITNTDNVDAGEGTSEDPLGGGGVPELLKMIVVNDGNVFKPRQSFNSSSNNSNGSGYNHLSHNELYPNNQRTMEQGAYNPMQPSTSGPCNPYEHQLLPLQGHSYQGQDFEFLMNGINPALMQQMAANQGTGALLMGGAMLQAPNQLIGPGDLTHFPGGLMTAQYAPQNTPHPLVADFMSTLRSGLGEVIGTPPAGMTGTTKNSSKSFVESSPAQASSAPPTGAEPVIRVGTNSSNTNIPAFDPSIMPTSLPTSLYAGYGSFHPPQSTPFPMSPLLTAQQQQQQHQQQQQQLLLSGQLQYQPQHQQHVQHIYQEQRDHNSIKDPFSRELSEAKVILEPLDLDAHKLQPAKKPPICPDSANKMSSDMMPRVSLTRLDDKKDKAYGGVMQYNVIQDSTQNLKIKLSKRGVKRRLSDDEEDESRGSSDFSSSLSERVKRCRRNASSHNDGKYVVDDDDDATFKSLQNDNSDLSSGPSSVSEASRRREEKKKRKHHHHYHHKHGSSAPGEGLDDDMFEGATVRKLYSLIEQVLEASEEIDLSSFKDDDEETSCLTEAVISRQLLLDLVSEAAKLKTVGTMNQVPYEKLIKLLTLLQCSIKQGLRNVPLTELDDEAGDDLFRELTLEHVTSGLDACLAAMLIMTSKEMPKQVFIEDVIDKVVRFTRNHLRNFIYPVFDPVYRVGHGGKGGQSSMKMKRSKASMSSMKDRTILSIYNKLTDITTLLAELVDIQEVTDSIVLQMSSLSVSAFFVENIPELQLNALKLVTNIFSKYEKHRQLILEDILSSLARLPSSKKNLRSYRLNVNENIQMVTALALQLIQCVVKLPSSHDDDAEAEDEVANEDVPRRTKKSNMDKEVVILSSYETAMRTAHNFLHVFLGKCSTKEEDNYRSLFGNFVNDLLSTVNKPEWPAAELLLSLLGNLLVRQFSCKSVEMSLRVASLDYLGVVAARLRKDAVTSRLDESTLDDIVSRILNKSDHWRQSSNSKTTLDDEDEDDDEDVNKSRNSESKNSSPNKICEINKTEILQKALLEYLAGNTESDQALLFARRFYVAQWLRDCSKEIEAKAKKMSEENRSMSRLSTPKKRCKTPRPKKPKKSKPHNSKRTLVIDSDDTEDGTEEEDTEEDDDEEDSVSSKLGLKTTREVELLKVTQLEIEKRKRFLFKETSSFNAVTSSIKQSKSKFDYDSALLVTRYLASNRPFSQSFDIYLTQILKVLNETAVAVRSRALKCLASVVEADPGVLARKDMQIAVHNRFTDSSTSVREAAIELVGKFILIRPELTVQYYNMLSDRILDTGISVRKRVIKIFRDICLEQPNFSKIPEMCVKMVRRVNDEDGIRKLVNETFQSMWFTPCRDKDSSGLLQKVLNIADVVSAASTNIGFEWLEQLMENLLKAEEDSKEKPVFKSCKQIVDCLVDNVLQLETDGDGKTTSSRLVACFSTLYLFCKVKPILLVKHCPIIHPYLNIKFISKSDVLIVSNAMKILELALPLMDHPGESFLVQLEEDITKLVLKQGTVIVQSCISCLSAVVKDITRNYKLVYDCFDRFFGIASKVKEGHMTFMGVAAEQLKMLLRRSLYVVGLLCKHFDFDSSDFEECRKMSCVREKVFELLLHFLDFPDDQVRFKALTALGSLATRYFELMLGKELRDIYQKMLTDATVESNMCCQVLTNIKEYLVEEEVKMAKADAEWKQLHDKENLKEMGDVQSGMASTIIQVYLKQILESFFHLDSQVRMTALEVVTLILNQGLVHPQQCMAHLISMGSDPNVNIRLKADKQIQEIDKKYPGFVQARAMQGIKMSCRLQRLLHHHDNQQFRGVRVEEDGSLTSLNSYVYTIVRNNRSNRRVLAMNALRMFEDKTQLEELLYMADNLAYFSYQLQDEPLFVIHQIDIILSVSGFNLLQSFKEGFYPPPPQTAPFENGKLVKVEDEAFGGQSKMECTEELLVKEELKEEVKEDGVRVAETKTEATTDDHSAAMSNAVKRKYNEDDDDEEDDPQTLLSLIPVEGDSLVELYMSLQGYLLLLVLKQHLKEMYGFTDNKIQQYSPMDFKAYEKSVNRKHGVKFHPSRVLDLLSAAEPLCQRNAEHRKEIVSAYLNFKELMASIDREDLDDEAANQESNSILTSNSVPSNSLISNGPLSSGNRSSGNSSKSRKTRHAHPAARSANQHASSTKKNKKKPKRRRSNRSESQDEESDDDDDDDFDDVDWQ